MAQDACCVQLSKTNRNGCCSRMILSGYVVHRAESHLNSWSETTLDIGNR